MMNLKKIIHASLAIAGISLFGNQLNAQSANESKYTFTDHAKVVSVNVLFNGVVSGIGAAKNHKSLLENIAKGAFGGLLSASGKYMIAKENGLAWPAKIITSFGKSISYNA